MISIDKLLEQVNVTDMSPEEKYRQAVAKINADYDKIAGTPGPLSLPRDYRWMFTPNRKVAEAAADRQMALDLAKKRLKAAKAGMVAQEDIDEAKYQMARQIAKARAQAAQVAQVAKSSTDEHRPSIAGKLVDIVREHPLITLGTVTGLAGLAALQKRKQRLPEPGPY